MDIRIFTLAEQGGLHTELDGRKRLIQGVPDRLCAWESELATEAKATKARCVSCGASVLFQSRPTTRLDAR